MFHYQHSEMCYYEFDYEFISISEICTFKCFYNNKKYFCFLLKYLQVFKNARLVA